MRAEFSSSFRQIKTSPDPQPQSNLTAQKGMLLVRLQEQGAVPYHCSKREQNGQQQQRPFPARPRRPATVRRKKPQTRGGLRQLCLRPRRSASSHIAAPSAERRRGRPPFAFPYRRTSRPKSIVRQRRVVPAQRMDAGRESQLRGRSFGLGGNRRAVSLTLFLRQVVFAPLVYPPPKTKSLGAGTPASRSSRAVESASSQSPPVQ